VNGVASTTELELFIALDCIELIELELVDMLDNELVELESVGMGD
jgi:hypothetical protein